MARLTWLPEVLRAAGLRVQEVDGWRTRGGSDFDPRALICHATAGSRTSTDAGEIRVLLNGSTSAPPPIAQLYLSRTGTWHVVASGRCNHALSGWGATATKGLGNSALIGIEAANDNRGEPWSTAQLDSCQRGVAAICRRMGWKASQVVAHREHQPGAKSDPHGIDMTKFRARVSALLSGEDDVTKDEIRAAVLEALESKLTVPGRIGERMSAAGWARQMTPWSMLAYIWESTTGGGIARAIGDGDQLDPAAIAEALADALPAELAQQVVDQLAARLRE